MIDSQARPEPVANRENRQSLWQILRETLRLYRAHGVTFTRPLLLPVMQMVLGAYASTLLIHFLSVHPTLLDHHLWLGVAALTLTAAVGIFLVIRGGWPYAVYWASLNRNAQEAIEQRPVDFQAAYMAIARDCATPYKTLLAAYCALPAMACLLMLVVPLLGGLVAAYAQSDIAAPIGLVLGFLLSGLFLLAWVAVAIFCSFAFQIVALEPLAPNVSLTFFKSAGMVLRRFWDTLGLQVILLILTNYLLTMPLALLMRLLRLSLPLDALHTWFLTTFLANWSEINPDSPSQLLNMAQAQIPTLAASLTDSFFMVIFTTLLLPLGTFAFTLLYRDIAQVEPTNEPHKL